jgi:hypothetical protein
MATQGIGMFRILRGIKLFVNEAFMGFAASIEAILFIRLLSTPRCLSYPNGASINYLIV